VGERKEEVTDLEGPRLRGGFAVQNHLRLAGCGQDNFKVPPLKPFFAGNAERFHGRLLGGEAESVRLPGVRLRFAILDFLCRVDSLEEGLARSFQGTAEVCQVHQIEPDSDNHSVAPTWLMRVSRTARPSLRRWASFHFPKPFLDQR